MPAACKGIVDVQMSQCRLEWDCKCQDVANNTYYCVRKLDQRDNSIFCQFDDEEQFVEAYDLNEDPYQLTNIYLRNSKANRNQQKEIIESLKKVKSFIKDSSQSGDENLFSKYLYEAMQQYLKDMWVNIIKHFGI